MKIGHGDRHKKGRNAKLRNEDSNRAKLKDIQIKKIRETYRKGNLSYADLALLYNVGKTQIFRIVKRKQRIL